MKRNPYGAVQGPPPIRKRRARNKEKAKTATSGVKTISKPMESVYVPIRVSAYACMYVCIYVCM